MIDDDLLIYWGELWSSVADAVRHSTEGLPINTDIHGDLAIGTEEGRSFTRVRIQRSHVGVYTLPLYYHPDILPASLKRYHSGKSTLRFTEFDERILDELAILMARCRELIGFY